MESTAFITQEVICNFYLLFLFFAGRRVEGRTIIHHSNFEPLLGLVISGFFFSSFYVKIQTMNVLRVGM